MQDTNPVAVRLQPLRNKVLSPEIARTLREAIFNGVLKPGEPIVEATIAEQLDVSRSPLREALFALEREGLVEIRPRRGTYVRNLTDRQIAEIATIRLPLESLALELARRNVTAEGIAVLHKQLDLMIELAKQRRFRELVMAEFDFHKLIWDASDHKLLSASLESICTPWFAFFEITFTNAGFDFEASARTHEVLLEYLKGQRDSSAEECYREHLSVLPKQVRDVLDEFRGLAPRTLANCEDQPAVR
jgi:DNA-binding GntR family transcriptional regulator